MCWPLLCILAKPSLTDAGQTAMPAPRMGKGQGPHLQSSPSGEPKARFTGNCKVAEGGREERYCRALPWALLGQQPAGTQCARQDPRWADTRAQQWAVGTRGSQDLSGWQGVAQLVSTHQHIRQILLRSMVKLTLKKLSKNPFSHKILLGGRIIYASKGFFPL